MTNIRGLTTFFRAARKQKSRIISGFVLFFSFFYLGFLFFLFMGGLGSRHRGRRLVQAEWVAKSGWESGEKRNRDRPPRKFSYYLPLKNAAPHPPLEGKTKK